MDWEQTVTRDVHRALAEDVGSGDLTAQLVPANTRAEACVISREAAVLCGQPWFNEAIHQLDPKAEIHWHAQEGESIAFEQRIVTISGDARALLTAERTALNFLQLLSGTATIVRRYADAVAGLTTQIVDSRKTLPGLRLAQKYAVRIGGGHNHRIGLYDGILIKENHIATAGGISAALSRASLVKAEAHAPSAFVQVEVETLDELDEALTAGAAMILLDNMSHTEIAEAVRRNRLRGKAAALLEVSGNVSLDTVRGYAELGIDRISIGSLTKHVRAIDYSMRMTLQAG